MLDFVAFARSQRKRLNNLSMIKKYCFLILSLVVLIACEKEKIKDNQDFIGNWKAIDQSGGILTIPAELYVDSDGRAEYATVGVLGGTTVYSGRFKIKHNEYIQIGFKKLDLHSYPVDSGTVWHMNLDGMDFYRSE